MGRLPVLKNLKMMLYLVVLADLILNLVEIIELKSEITLYLRYLYIVGLLLVLAAAIRTKELKDKIRHAEWLEQNTQVVLKNIPCAIKVISPDFDVVMMNKEATHLFGINEEEAVGNKCYNVFGDGKICDDCPVPQAVASRAVYRTNKHVLKTNRDCLFVEQTAIPIVDNNGSVQYILSSALDLTEKEELKDMNNRMFFETVSSLAKLIGSRDHSTGSHSKGVHDIGVMIGKQLGLSADNLEEIAIAALLHDIGKIGIPENILNKKGKLTAEEYKEIQQHCQIGYDALKNIEPLRKIAEYVRFHHEAFDGSGYPCGLKGEEIPLVSRTLSVADVFEALTADRVYREAMSIDQALTIMKNGRGTKFDPVVLDAFLECIDKTTNTRNIRSAERHLLTV